MRPALLRCGLVLAGGLLLGFWLHTLIELRANTSRGREPSDGPAKLTFRGSDAGDLWPARRAWAWAVDPVATKAQVGVCVRTVESKIPPGTSPSFPTVPQLPATGAERRAGWTQVGDDRLSGRVTCQLIDLREVGLGDVVGEKPLRLLVGLRVSGGLVSISGSEAVLAGETIEHTGEVEPRWTEDELHLLTVHTRAGDRLYAHYVLVQQRDGQ